MRHFKFFSIILVLALLGNACKKESTTTPAGTATTNPLTGSWKVSSFIKDSVDLTSQFNGYSFTCNSNGVLIIQGNGNTYNCSWDWNDANYTMCHFHIMGCDNNSVFWECEDDWDLTSHDTQNCHFKTHNPHHNNTMTWTKI